MKTGVELIAEERARQVTAKGWTAEHDDAHTNGEIADAAACYARTKKAPYRYEADAAPGMTYHIPFWWPWGGRWWKPCPHDRVRELVKAGALIAAEIDRLQRKAPR